MPDSGQAQAASQSKPEMVKAQIAGEPGEMSSGYQISRYELPGKCVAQLRKVFVEMNIPASLLSPDCPP